MPRPRHTTNVSGGSRAARGSRVINFGTVGRGQVVEPPSLEDGKFRCPVCRNAVSRNVSGYLRKHRDLFGHDCYNRAVKS